MKEIYVKAGPSPIHGVGVFAVTPIAKGRTVKLWSREKLRFVKKPLRGALGKMALMFGVETERGFWCPKDFNRAEIGWYINHSDRPNMTYVNDITLRAMRAIKAGEELTVNYIELEGPYHDTGV